MSGVLKLGNVTLGTENSGKVDLTNVGATSADSVTATEMNLSSTNHTWTVKAIDEAIVGATNNTKNDADSGQLAIYNGTTKLWGITEHGYVVKPNIPHFWVYSTGSNFAAPTSSYTVFDFTNAQHNSQGMYDLTTNRATAPVAGLYQFIFWTNVYNASGNRMIQRLQRNGTDTVFHTMGYIGNNSDTTYNMSHVYKLSAGDYVEAAWKVGTGTVSNGLAYNGFIGYLIG